MGKLKSSDVNQDSEWQAGTVCGVLSEDSHRDPQFLGGEDKPRVIVLLYSCDNNRKQ